MDPRQLNRRQLLKGGMTLAGGAAILPLSRSAHALSRGSAWLPDDAHPKRLVLIQLYGGNDGLETVVPYENDIYHRMRPTTRIKKEEVLRIDDSRGFHPVMTGLHKLWSEGRMAIVEGTGYAHPVLSHFKSLDIWHTAREEGRGSGEGWIGRLRAAAWGEDPRTELVTHIGHQIPYSLESKDYPALTFSTPSDYLFVGNERDRATYKKSGQEVKPQDASGSSSALARLRAKLRDSQATSPRVLEATSAYKPRVEYPKTKLGQSMRSAAAMIEGGFSTRVFSVSLGNFDTHGPSQRKLHRQLLKELDGAVCAFLDDLRGTEAEKNTLVVAYSEFGRRLEENASQGTDHGAAGPLFAFGAPVAGGLYGQPSSLSELDANGNLIYTTDFRRPLATIVQDWFGVEQELVLPQRYEPISFLKA